MEPAGAIRVLVVDDHPVVRRGMAALLSSIDGVHLVGEAATGDQAVREAQLGHADVVIMDVQMPVVDGIEATRRLTAVAPDVAVLVLTMVEDDETVLAAMLAGARGYLLKGAGQDEILAAVRSVVAGQTVIGPGVAQRLIAALGAPPGAAVVFPQLTVREREILEHLARGRSNGAIAAGLGLAPKTVGNHVSSIFAKLRVATRAEAIVLAHEQGLGRPRASEHRTGGGRTRDRRPDDVATLLAPTPSTGHSPASARHSALACLRLPGLGAAVTAYPGGDPDAPPATAEQLRDWATSTAAALGPVAANVPAGLDRRVAVLRTTLADAQRGDALDDAAPAAALAALDRWGRESCGFTALDVVNPGAGLDGVPATLPSGPVSISFTNAGPPENAGFVLLAVRVREGAAHDLQGVRDGSEDLEAFTDVAAVVQPAPGEPTGIATSSLTPGRYLIVSPVGTPPRFSGTLATELGVTAPDRRG